MNQIIDGTTSWPGIVTEISNSTVKVKMVGTHGIHSVCSGQFRQGAVFDSRGSGYPVKLPAACFSESEVIFKRR